MSENSENKEMKTSGLRPPTKIPTMGVSRLPSSSSIKLDGVNSIVPKIGGGPTVKKTADMPFGSKHHDGFHKKTTDERKSSSSSESFMGDARRLSEAGVRRSSGNSVVLTEDTDKFIIGNRIWVGGTKPGQIAYIGETNFGNGDWAGIVLDEPIGKNDGSVSGTRYFQCEPKRGIFARLTNLTLAPLSSSEDSMVQNSFAKVKPLGFSTPMPKREASTVSSVKPTAKSTVSNSQQSLSKNNSDLKIGDRVIISSGQGSKLGVLKYRGATQFAPGEWCGIELDDPLGKNDGSVEGIRYFECEDKFGLFTPIAKVSKSPMSSSRMSTNCAIHKGKRSPGSMNGSMISAITTNTMSSIPSRVRLGVTSLSYKQTKVSDLDRLKLQLTQVKKENELLRLQVTKAANQADAAEKKLEETLIAQGNKPSEAQNNDLIILQNQLDNMKKQIDDEKEKIQNLQFTNEEQNVVNIELQNKNSELLIKIKELEFDLDKERNLTKDVEKETMKIFEKEEELCRLKEELESLKKLIDNNEDELQKSVSNLSSEVVDKEAILNTLRQQLNENSQIHDRLLKEANEKLLTTTEQLNKVIEEKNKKLEQNQEMIDQLNEGIKCLSALKNEEHDDIVNNLKNELSKLKDEYKIIIDKKDQEIKKCVENCIKKENDLKQELTNLLENKNQEIEQLQTKYTDTMCLNSSEKEMVETLKLKLFTTTEELNKLKAKKLVYSKEDLEKVLMQLTQLSLVNIEDLKKKFDESLLHNNKKIEICNTSLIKIREEIFKEKSSLEVTFNNKIKEKDDEIKSLFIKLNTITTDFEQLEKINQNIDIELKSALKSLNDKTNLLTEFEKKYKDLESEQDMNRNELEKELTAKLQSINEELICLKSEKSILAEKHENYVKEMEKTVNDMNNKSKQDNILIENLNKSLKELTLSKQNALDDMNKRVLQLEEERGQLSKHQHSELATKDEQINSLSKKLEETLTEKQKQDLSNANLQVELTNEAVKYQGTIKDLQNKIEELEINLTSNQESFKKELELSSQEKETIKLENSNLLEKLKLLKDSKLKLEEKLALNEVCKQDVHDLNVAIKEKEKMIDDNETKNKQLNNLIAQIKNDHEIILKKKEEEIKELLKIGEENMNLEKLSLEEKTKVILNEKDKENLILSKKIEDLENMKISFEKQLKEINETQKQDFKKLNERIQEKIKIIEDNNIAIEQLNNLVSLTKNEYEIKLQGKEDQLNELLKAGVENLNTEKKQYQIMLDVKDEEIIQLKEKLSSLDNIKINLEEQLEKNKTQEHGLTELKKVVEEKTKVIDDNNLKIDQLNNLIVKTKIDFEAKIKEKENEFEKLMKIEEDKLTTEKLTFETRIQTCLDEKNAEIKVLKTRLQEFVENNTEKELMLKLESTSDALEKVKVQVLSLEEVKKDLEKTLSEHKTTLEQLELSKANMKADMMETIEKQQSLNAEVLTKNKIEYEKLVDEKLQIQKQVDELKNECSKLQSMVAEQNLEIENIKKNTITELKKSIEEKTKIISDNVTKVELLNDTIVLSEKEFIEKLKEKEDKFEEYIKAKEEKLVNITALLNEKDKEILNLVEKLHSLENVKLNSEKQSELSKIQENDLAELKKVVEEKTKFINDNNSKIEQLNSLIAQTKIDFEARLKEKENKIDLLVKIGEEKLTTEKMAFESRIQTCLDEKNTEIEVLKTRLQELVENNTEKELMLKLESISDAFEKEKVRVLSLEAIKKDLEKTLSEHKTTLAQLEKSNTNMKADMIEATKKQDLNAEPTTKNEIQYERLVDEKLQIQKQVDELKNECSILQSMVDKKNLEIENLKSQTSKKLEDVDCDSKELNRLKVLLEKDRNTKSHLEFRIQELTDENHHLNERIENDGTLFQTNHNIVQEKCNIEKKYEEAYSMLKIKENQILVLQTELNSWKLKDMEKSKNNNTEEKTNKSDAHLLAEKNEEIKMLNSIILGLHKKLSAVMEIDVSEFEVEKNPNGVSKEEYQKLYKTSKNNVKLKECENLSLKQEISKLKTENDRYSEYKTKCESLENDKKILQRLVVNYESSHSANVKNEKSDTKSETEKILEEKDWQINLLNNIIADLHSKVSDNKFKMEALEKQILDSGLDQSKKVRLRTTRLYCERCEIFDSHDSEDCPEKPESPKFHRKRRVVNDNSNKAFEEPFCVCCDMFGHTANECEESTMTF